MVADGPTIALVLLAALLHATWNALVKSSGDPLVNVTIVAATGGTIAIPFVLLQPLPLPETWQWLGASAVVHLIYQLALVRMYRLGDLSQVYPIARGLAPILVASLAAVFAGESLELHQTVGLVVSAGAIVVLGRSHTRPRALARSGGGARAEATAEEDSSRRAVWTAVGVAVLIGLYSYSDGRGVRSALEPAHFIAWSFLLGAAPLVLFTFMTRRRTGVGWDARQTRRGVAGGLMATLGYGIALWAMSRMPMALVSSLRESSVLFAALIGAILLRESFGIRRVLASAMLVVGLVLVQLRLQ